MAIFTVVQPQAFAEWARARYGFAAAGDLSPIAEGIENTNYRFAADGRGYVFTIFELWGAEEVAYYAALMRHLSAAGAPALAPLGEPPVGDWEGKPCLVVPFVEGDWKRQPTADDCAKMGDAAAALHIAAADFAPVRPNPRGREWRAANAKTVRDLLDAPRQKLLDEAMRRDAEFCQAPLPAAACHCDLFRNNVLWADGEIAAVIDFYFGGGDALIFDLAVCACDWCFDGGEFVPDKMRALLGGYAKRRKLAELEKELFADALGAGAARFWVSRHYDLHFPRQAAQLTPHDPARFEEILRAIPPRQAVEKWLEAA